MSITNFGIENHTHQCQECGMKFYNSHELVNHIKKFCSASGFNSLQGLAQYEHSSNFSKKLKNYGANSLGSMKYQPQFSPKQLAKQAIDVEKHRQQLAMNRPYSNTNANNNPNFKNEYRNAIGSDMDKYQQSKVQKYQNPPQSNSRVMYGQKILQGSEVSIKSLGNFGKQISQPQIQTKRSLDNSNLDHNYYSPPTNLPSLPFAKHTGPSVLDKSNSSIAKMSLSQKRDYASDKLVELDNIAVMYDKSGGMNMDFRKNLDKMRKFYRKMLEDDQPTKQYPGQFAESRAQTPISKLRESQIDENKMQRNKNNTSDSLDRQLMSKLSGKKTKFEKNQNKQQLSSSKKNNNINPKNQNQNIFSPQAYGGYLPQSFSPQSYPSQFYPPNFPSPYPQQPQIIMMPPYPQQQQQNQSNNQINEQIMYFQKMMEMKNQQNKKLLKMLIDTKREKNPSQMKSKVQEIRQSRASMLQRDGQLSLYHMETPMDMSPSTQQKILLALQREELDELRLLSTLPSELQQLKMQSVMKLIQQRTQLQKQIIQQKVKRLQQQQRNQLQEEQTRLDKDEWANQQRKKLIGHQMDDIIGQFQRKVNGEDSQQDEDEEQQQQQGQEYQ